MHRDKLRKQEASELKARAEIEQANTAAILAKKMSDDQILQGSMAEPFPVSSEYGGSQFDQFERRRFG